MSRLVLTNGTSTVTWFDEFFKKEHRSVIVKVSSGTDSALILYYMMKFAQELSSDLKIYPFHSVNLGAHFSYSEKKARKIIKILKEMFPKANLQPLEVLCYRKRILANGKLEDKNVYSDPYLLKMKERVDAEYIISGSTLNMPENLIKNRSDGTFPNPLAERNQYDTHVTCMKSHNNQEAPWINSDKKFIAAMYRQEGLMDNIYPLTESCTALAPVSNSPVYSLPCKECYWCQEKFWAFGSYDGGVK